MIDAEEMNVDSQELSKNEHTANETPDNRDSSEEEENLQGDKRSEATDDKSRSGEDEEISAVVEETDKPEEGTKRDENFPNNLVTVELSARSERKESPEIVVEPKVVERQRQNVRPETQTVRRPQLPLLNSKYHPLPSERPKTTAPSGESRLIKPNRTGLIRWFQYVVLYLILTAILLAYALGGACLFSHLEKQREIEYNAKIDKWKNDTAILLATELRQVNPYEGIWARKVFYYLEVFEKDLLKASAIGYRRLEDEDREQRWTWTSSLFFSVSLMTTTGYGSMTPRSKLGRTATTVYSLLGIPLAFLWFMITGRFLAISFATIFKTICCNLCGENIEQRVPGSYTRGYLNSSKVRSNLIAPIEEEKLIVIQNSHLKKSTRLKEKMVPTKMDGKTVGRESLPPRTESTQLIECRNTYCLLAREHFEAHTAKIMSMPRTIDYTMAIIYSLLFFAVYFVFCSVAFSLSEGWELTDIFYFNYLMFMTLGPGCHEMEEEGAEIKLKSNSVFLAFLCCGYCILSMIVNLIYLLVRSKGYTHQVKLKLKAFDASNLNGKY